MLIDKGFSQGDIVSIKLVGGEEIIARYDSETPTEVKISKPLAVTLSGQGLGMIPWIFLAETTQDVKVKMHAIVAMAKPKKDAADQYQQGTTGIALT
jgi:hypothetical protein